MPENTKAPIGGCKRFECRVIGFPRPTIQWFKDGRNITKHDRYEFDYSVDGVITMVIKDVTDKDQGVYSCRAENSEGWAATAAFLNVRAIQCHLEEELTSVHQMKFEISGVKGDKEDVTDSNGKHQLETRYNDFIETFGEKLNGKRERIKDIIGDEDNDGQHEASIDSELQNDSGIGHDDGSLTMSSITDTSSHDYTGGSASKLSTDVELSNKGRGPSLESDVSINEDNTATPGVSPKRRLSDLDVYLRMMNDKVSSYLTDIPDEEAEHDTAPEDVKQRKPSTTDQGDGKQSKPTGIDQGNGKQNKPTVIDRSDGKQNSPTERDQGDEKQSKPIGTDQSDGKQSKPIGTDQGDGKQSKPTGTDQGDGKQSKPTVIDQGDGKQNRPTVTDQGDGKHNKPTVTEKSSETPTDKSNDSSVEKQQNIDTTVEIKEQTLEDKPVDGENCEDENEDTQNGSDVNDKDALDEISEFLTLGRKKSRRSTVDSGFGDDDFRPNSSESEDERSGTSDNADKKRHLSKEEIIEKNKKQKQKHLLKQQADKDKPKRNLVIPNICFEEVEEEGEEECSHLDTLQNGNTTQDQAPGTSRDDPNPEDVIIDVIPEDEKMKREMYPEKRDKSFYHVEEITDFPENDLANEPEFYSSSNKKKEDEFPLKIEIKEDIVEDELVPAQAMAPQQSSIRVETDTCEDSGQTADIECNNSLPEPDRQLEGDFRNDTDDTTPDIGNNNEDGLVSAMALSKQQQECKVEDVTLTNCENEKDNEKDHIKQSSDTDKHEIEASEIPNISTTADVQSKLHDQTVDMDITLEHDENGKLKYEDPEGKSNDNKPKRRTLGDVVADSFNDETEADYQTIEDMRNTDKYENKEIEERLQLLGRTYGIHDIKEGSISESDNEIRARKDNDRKSTLKKRHMLVESDDEDDDTRSRSVNDDDYFASTESLGMGVSRESLDKTFSQFDLFRGEGISEKEEYLSRSCSKDSENNDDSNIASTINPLDLMKYSEYSDEESSDIISSEPENMDKVLAENAQKITIEISSLSQAWSDEEPYEENTTVSDIKDIPDTLPEVPNKIFTKNKDSDVLVRQSNVSHTEEVNKVIENAEILEWKAPDHVKDSKSELSATQHASQSETEKYHVEETRENIDLSKGHLTENEEPESQSGKITSETDMLKKTDIEDKTKALVELQSEKDEIANQVEPLCTKKGKSSTVDDQILEESSTLNPTSSFSECIKDDITQDKAEDVESQHPTQNIPKITISEEEVEPQTNLTKDDQSGVDIRCDTESRDTEPTLTLITDSEIGETQKDWEGQEDVEMTSSVVTDEKPHKKPKIVRASADVTVTEGKSLVLEWEISGHPTPNVQMYKDGTPLQFCEGDGVFQEEEFVTMEILDAVPEDSGCYELHINNTAGSDISMINVMVKETLLSKQLASGKVDSDTEEIRPPEFCVVPRDVTLHKGQTVVIKASVAGFPQPKIEWLRDGEVVQNSDDIDIIEETCYCCLVIPSPEPVHVGEYLCRATNDCGIAEAPFYVRMEGVQGDYPTVAEETIDKTERPNTASRPDIETKDIGKLKEREPKPDTENKETVKPKQKEPEPVSPFVLLEVSESSENFSKKFLVTSPYCDDKNNVILEIGDVVELLNKTSPSHWLVRKELDKNQVCYVPAALLVPAGPENHSQSKLSKKSKDQQNPLPDQELQLKAIEKNRKLIHDLLESEADYICDLKDVFENYCEPEKEQHFPQEFIERNKDIFGNIMDLYKFHHEKFLPELMLCDENPEKVGSIFLEKRDSFTEYLPFCAGRKKSEQCLESEEVQKFLKAYSKSIGDSEFALDDLLSRPGERIHEYIDLLKNLIKYTSAAGGDTQDLMSAVHMLSDLCREVENLALLDNVEGFEGDVKKLGPVLRHDKVKVWKDEKDIGEEHHIFLFSDKLLVAKTLNVPHEKDLPKLEFNQMIDLKDVDVYEDALEDTRTVELWDSREAANTSSEIPALTLQTLNPYTKQALVRDLQEAQKTLGVVKSNKMPEHRKITPKTTKVKPSKQKTVTTGHGGQLDNESDRSSDDFKLLDTASDAGSYMTPEFEDGTTRPIFRKKLQKTVVADKAMVRLECMAVGIPHPKVLWLKNNRPLKSTDKCIVKADGAKHSLEFPEAHRDDTGLYTARAMNVNGSTISTAELLVGNAQPAMLKKYKEGLADSEFQSPAYFFQMNNCQVEEGRLARFDCRVVAYPKPEIIWMKDGKVVEPGDRYKLLNFNDEIYSLLVQNVETDDTGRYTCWAHNKYGEAMTEAYLNVIGLEEQLEDSDIAPKFLTKFYDQTVTDGVPVEFQCLIAGKPEPIVTWLMDDLEIKATENIIISHEDNLCSLKIKEAKIKSSGNYSCHIKNPLGDATCSAGLTVLDKKIKGVPMLPKFLKRISDVNTHTGEDVVYEVVVVGEPKPKVSWMYNHKHISETHRRFKTSNEGDIYRLTMTELRIEDQGKITCKAVNSEGEVYCSSDLAIRRAPPEILEERPGFKQRDFDAKYGYSPTFMKKIDDVYAPQGKSAKFECRVMGIPEPTITWMKDGKPLSPGNRYWINRDGGNCTLTIRDVVPSDKGTYTCTVANAAGEASCNAHLKLDDAKDREVALDKDYPSFTRRLSRDSTKSDSAPTLPYDKPTLSDIRDESVRLSWSPVYTSNLPQDAKNVKYVIEARELPGFDWNKMASGIHGNTHLLKNLKPEREYAFRVRAENQYGSSDATQPTMLSRQKPVEDDLMEQLHVKLPEYRSPPKLPSSKPVVTDMGLENLRLAWKPAAAPVAAKKAAPISYRVEAQELPATDWLPVATRLRDTSYYMPELHSDRDYNIRIRAENKYGLSDPSESIWVPKATAFPGVPVKRPEIVEIEPEAVRVHWQRVDVPAFSYDEKPLTYMLEMQEPPMRDWREIARNLRDTSYTVRGLKPSQDYRFRVRACSPDGKVGEPSPTTSLFRTLATTRSPIDRLELEDYEPDFEGVRLMWNRVDIPPYHSDDEPLRYMIEINEPPLDEWRPLVSGLPTTRYRVTDLVPDRDYKFRVRALTPYGISPPSHTLPVAYRRPIPVPSRPIPQSTRLEYDDSDFLRLSWKPPVVDTKRPIKYQVQMQTPPMTDWRPLVSGINDTSYRIRGLGPSRDYMFRVVPETSLGPLQPLPPVSLTSLPAPITTLPSRPDILDLQPDSLRLSWRRPVVDTFKPLSYRIEMQEPPTLDWRPIATGVTDTNYHVTGLRPNRDYIFRVTPFTSTGSLEPLPFVTLSSMPVRPRLYNLEPKATDVGKDSVKLSWRPAEMPYFAHKHTPIRYIVEMRTMPSSDWIPVARNVPETSYIVKGLRPENDYQFRIKAQTDFGSSEPTLPVTVYRKPVPIFPRREPTVTSIAPDSVVLSWQPADLPSSVSHMPLVNYRIEVQDPPGIGNWRTLISNIPKTSYHVTGLRPDRDYLFRVRSQADSVMTEPTLPVYLSRRAGPPRMPPEQPYIFEVHPESVKLQWRSVELPSRITDYSPVTYRLEMQELPRSDWITLARGIPHTDFHVTNLNPDKGYNFRIRAENDMGASDPTPVVSLQKRATAPTIPQEEPLIYDVSPSGSFMMSWRPADVSTYLTDGSPVTYTIYVQEPPSSTWRPLVRRIPHTYYHVSNLLPDKDYCFRVQAENEFGVSRPTLPVRLLRVSDWRTPIDLPEITDIDDTTSSLNLRWRQRSVTPFSKGPVSYHIESWEPKHRSWNRVATGISDTNYRITGLPLDHDYLFRIRAEAERVLSEPTYPVSLSRFKLPRNLPVPRPQLYDVEPESVRLSWQPLHLPRYEPRHLPRRYGLELRELPSRDWKPVASDIPDTSYRVTGLRPRQDYEFRIRGFGEDGPTDYTYPAPLYRRPVIPRLPLEAPRITEVRDDYVDLNWRLVDIPAFNYDERPLSFLIEAQTPPRYDWTPVARNVTGSQYRVTGLQRNQDYIFRIRAQYPTGLSEPSPYIPVYRRPIRPGIPISHPEIWEEEPYRARLRWRRVHIPPYHHTESSLKYHIEVQEPPFKDWRPLARGVNMTEYTVSDLVPRKDYLFRIRAETPDGDISDPTPPIAYYRSRLPMTREPSKAYEYKAIEQDYSVPSRSYIDHLTTYIPPRLPIEKPELFEISPETATLTWKPARVPDRIRDTCNLSYTIEVRNPPGLDWRELVTGLTSTCYDMKNLHPRLDYLFRIRAWNEYGCSEPTLPISLHRPIEISDDYSDEEEWDDQYRVTLGDLDRPIEEAPPKLPMEAPRITDGGESAMLSWFPARIPAYAKKTPITYIVEIKEPSIPGWSRLSSGISDTSHFVEGLRPNQEYQFRIKAETQFGVSDPTLPVSLDRRQKDKSSKRSSIDMRKDDSDLDMPQRSRESSIPSGVPPRIPSSRPLISRQYADHLTLSWLPGRVPSYVKNSKISYLIEVRELPSTKWKVLVDNLEDNEYDVTNLLPDQNYMFRVRAKNSFGTSDPTLPANVIHDKDDYVPLIHSRSGSTDSGSPWIRSRASSVESLRKQKSFDFTDDESDSYISKDPKGCPPEFKATVEDVHYGVDGKSAKIILGVRGYPLPTTTWFYLGDKVDYGDLYKASISPSGNATLEIIKLTNDLVGDYKCCAENEHGAAVKIVRLEIADPPTILETTKDLVLESRRSGKLVCRVDGIPYPTVKFLKDCRPLASSSRMKIQHDPPDQWTLSMDNAITMDSGVYTCVAENMAGKATCSAKVTIEDRDVKPSVLQIKEGWAEDFYYILEEIGRGRHGIVRRVIDKSSGKEFAAKFIYVSDDHQRQFFQNEIDNLRSLNHKNVLGIVDAFQTDRRLVIVTELITGDEVLDYLIDQNGWTESDTALLVQQLLETVKYLHKKRVLHLDIKPSNLFISPDSEELKLIDFGFSRYLRPNLDTKLNYGTPGFTSPEQIANAQLSPATDVWGIGTLTYILLSGLSPFDGQTDTEKLTKILSCDWQFDDTAFDGVSKEAKDFISKLLLKEPSERLSVEECLSHPWIKNCSEGQNHEVNPERLRTFQSSQRQQRKLSGVRTMANLHSLNWILANHIDTSTLKQAINDADGQMTFPDSVPYGEFLDQESWYEWQSRFYYGLDTDADSESDTESVSGNPSLKKEREWLRVAEEFKQQSQKPQDFFPKDDEEEHDNPEFTIKLHDIAFQVGDDITLSCHVTSSSALKVSWYRNEELISDGNRVHTSFSDDGIATVTVTAAKPYDDGIYKCVARNQTGKSVTWSRVSLGDVPSQPGRPVVTEISSFDALLVWEQPDSDGNSDIISYRVDYRKSGSTQWIVGARTIDDCALVTGLELDTGYRFRVCCNNKFGTSSYSIATMETITKPRGAADLEISNYTALLLSQQHEMLSPQTVNKDHIRREITLQDSAIEENYTLSDTLARGKFSSFVLSRSKSSDTVYITKVVPYTEAEKDTVLREFEILRKLSHESLLRLQDGCLHKDVLYLVMEYFTGVNVVEHFSFKTKYSEDMVATVIRQVLDGVHYLHQRGYVHLNLQPDSIVMVTRRRLNIRLTGFTLARQVTKEGQVVPIEGHPEFMAPEVVAQEKTSYSADIWTVGVLTFILLSGESPFVGITPEVTFANIAYNRYNALAMYENITKDALKFVFRTLKRIPRNRVTAEECLDDKWIQGSDIMVKARKTAVFSTAKLRVYVDRSYREARKYSSIDLKTLQQRFHIKHEAPRQPVVKTVPEVKVQEAPEKLESQKPDAELVDRAPETEMEKEKTTPDPKEETEVKENGILKSESVEDIADNLVSQALDDALQSTDLTKEE